MTKFNYKYTKLDDLRDGANKVNVYGIIRFIARCDDIKMVILDETEMPVYCEFTDGPKTDVPLANDMIVRVHRGLVRRSRNNEMILSGRIGAAGLHLVAWAIDDAGDDVRVKTSPKFSFDPDSDSKRVHELRQFWKNRFHNDGPARLIFFYHIFEVGSTKAVEEVQPRELGNKENEQNSNQLNLAPEEEEDDHFFGGRTSGPSTSVESDEQNEQPIVDGEYMRALQDKLKQWRNVPSHTKTFVELIFHKRINEKGEFFNVNCQILSILVPRVADGQYPPRNLPSFLRVCDGTVVTSGTKGIQVSPEYYSTKSDLFKERVNYADLQISDFVHYISCWDEFAEIIANDFQAGDLVNVRNIHSKLNIDKERPFEHLFTLRGGGQAFQRGIALLERPQPIVGDLKQQKRSNDENIGEAEEEQQNVKRSKYNEEDVSLEKTDSFPSQSQ